MDRYTLRVVTLIVVSVLVAILLASALNNFTRLSDSALADNSLLLQGGGSVSPRNLGSRQRSERDGAGGEGGDGGNAPRTSPGKNYLPIIFLNSATAGGAWLLSGNAGTNPASDFLGTSDNVSLTLRANNVVGWRLAPSGANTPNVIGGYSGNNVTGGVKGATISGGGENLFVNQVTDDYGTVGGGGKNQAGNNNFAPSDSLYTTVGGGFGNTASGPVGTVSGGEFNTASGFVSTIGGGDSNIASGIGSFVGGGGYDGSLFSFNWAIGKGSTIGGGLGNNVSGNYATVPGGISNSAAMSYTLAAGRRAKANHTGTFVWAVSTNADFASTANDQFLVRSNGGVGINTNSPTANTLTVSGNGLKVGTTGTTLAVVQSGTATMGVGNAGVNVYAVAFPSAFSSPPKVIVTLRGQDYNDVFAVTTRNISTTQFQVNVYRIDLNGNSWSQTLQLDWFAWQ